jgi:tetratricopeptide (TPR) repeat protein
LGYIYLEVGKYDNAIRELEQAVMLDSVSQPYRLYLGIAYARAGWLNETRKQLDVFDEIEKESETVSFGRAVLLAELGEVDSALFWLNRAYEERYRHLLYLKPVQVMFDPIRSDPRFMEIYHKVWPEED